MADIELHQTNQIIFEEDGSNFREQVERLEGLLINSGSSDVFVGDSDQCPLKHTFSDGIYIREISIKEGMFLIGKIHKLENSFFLMKGKLQVFTEQGIKEIEAPYYGSAEAGTKRVVLALEDSVFVNVHPNPNNIREVEKLEDVFVVSSYKEFEEYKLLNG
jgi:hypothetical protein